MELKDMILQTLTEIQESPYPQSPKEHAREAHNTHIHNQQDTRENQAKGQNQERGQNQKIEQDVCKQTSPTPPKTHSTKAELDFLYALKEKTLVLFEGLQSPQAKDLSAKLDLVINYLQYQLSIIDQKLEE
ncbi:hypothetical protein BKH46_06275 [Helicobacter sp. 12S02634-8]|uniref:CiaD-like domain-containing protein n=1 Tax=Helicobacter sp. 12S02634-8 TaxID=1476199 RepID=UPI000BA589A4|nr:hypothetical protein [Helicobacter sp. 12S02634-8]PAF46817.1 hypothetical protein BKH46_06275 [Helicobacter sp. 12S02634-8]